jgi:TetR/AcrR family transcriptional regulator, mexCD-oprJ operon repressor
MRHVCLAMRNAKLIFESVSNAPEPAPLHPPRRRQALQERVAAAILEAAARVLATGGEQASMNDVAAAAGVARATLYRYFPSRQALLDELARVAADEAGARLASARVEEVAAEEGVKRAVRALIEAGDPFTVVARERVRPDPEQFEQRVHEPLRRLFERAQRAGEIREDIPKTWLTDALVGLVVSVLSSRPLLGREDTIAVVSALFLDGARPRPVS